jgi:hypothetical protein
MKLVSVEPAKDGRHKYTAIFDNDGRKKTTHFGLKHSSDYLINKNTVTRANYRKRHANDLKTNDPSRAGYLSMFLLWGESTSLATNISEYKKKFNL